VRQRAVRVGIGLAVLVTVAACAQPGQLGQPLPEPAPAQPVAAPAPMPVQPPAPEPLWAVGRLPDRLDLRTTGPSNYQVQTLVLEPGQATGWHTNPGTELTIVRSGRVVLQTEDDCDPEPVAIGVAMVVEDEQAHQLRNDGAQPAELVITHLLDPAEPAQTGVPAAC
jgi:quercetin dioxygenase-like cupin family protein